MKKKFKISFSSSSKEKRPQLSYLVREYYSELIEDNLFSNNVIALKEGWSIDLVIMFMEEAPRFKSEEIFLGKGAQTVKSEYVKIYDMIIPLKLIENEGNTLDSILIVLQQGLTLFFTETFRKVSKTSMEDCWKKVDMGYLRSLPYPAPLKEQKYVGDILRDDGTLFIYQM